MSEVEYQRLNLVKLCLVLNNRSMLSKRIAEWCCRYVAVDSNFYLTNCLAGCETPDRALRAIKRVLNNHPECFYRDGVKWARYPYVMPDINTVDPVVPALFVTPSMRVETVALLPRISVLTANRRRVAAPAYGSLVDPFYDSDSEDEIDEEEEAEREAARRRNRRRRRDANDDQTVPRAQRARMADPEF